MTDRTPRKDGDLQESSMDSPTTIHRKENEGQPIELRSPPPPPAFKGILTSVTAGAIAWILGCAAWLWIWHKIASIAGS